MSDGPMRRVTVWDGWIRLVHWSVVILLGVSYASIQAGWMKTHYASGYAVLALVLFLFNQFWLLAISAGAPPLPGVLNDAVSILLPPQLALSDVYDGLLRGEIVWGASAFAAGYGVFWLLIAGLVLKLRDWP